MKKAVCIHGHFYQPPRENPWLESVELQDSASPYHDWNERITYECYAPNARARLMDGEGKIEGIVSNYSRMSFNFGPTVLSWLKEKMPDIHDAIVNADKKSRQRFAGHGSAIAQCYYHMIMPLANARDKQTQVLWGIRDFESRFGRNTEGMWLPEMGVDNESLEVLANQGIKFTLLSPFQASRVRPLDGKSDWQDVNGARIDPTMPYLVKLASGRSIAVFFYDAPIAQAVAFERVLQDGGRFAHRITTAFDDGRDHDQLVNIATDGESYGHHFGGGDMALAFALSCFEKSPDIKLSIYGEFLADHPPTHEVEVHQPSAWSCSHGVGRWKENCGCNSGRAGWNQEWRTPLRNALDVLRDRLVPIFKAGAKGLLKDPWLARDNYINVILDRSPENLAKFFTEHGAHELTDEEKTKVVRLLEMQRHAMLMYTSCGWFFDEISGLETVQIIQYAARAIQLASGFSREDLETGFLEILSQAKSNIPEHRDGRYVYEHFAKPALMTREKVAAHYAISSLFESYPEEARVYAFIVKQEDRQVLTAGNARLAIGHMTVKFTITLASESFDYVVVHMGDHNLTCGIRPHQEGEAYTKMVEDMRKAFEVGDFPELVRLTDRHFGEHHYSIRNLFRDEQRKVLGQILGATREEIHNTYRLLTDRYATLTRFLNDLHVPPLNALAPATEFVLNSDLRKQFENGHVDPERVKSLLAEVKSSGVALDAGTLAYAFKGHMDRLSEEFEKAPDNQELLQQLSASASLLPAFPTGVNLWKAQNIYDQIHSRFLPVMQEKDDEKSKAWIEKFNTLGQQLGFHFHTT
ncbi:MAG TPA: DUF3536 domain-containing protein [Candidatus Sulfotelmatobacter sp.]|nr:DUF3536 domain-containing protein [Candidatus Sulfotelmatobacter sp.]